jgi:hypothetical protein
LSQHLTSQNHPQYLFNPLIPTTQGINRTRPNIISSQSCNAIYHFTHKPFVLHWNT